MLRANGSTDAYMRPLAWRGSEQMGVSAQRSKIHLAIASWPWGAYFGDEAVAQGHQARHFAVAAARALHRADRVQGRRPLHDLHPVAARGAGQGP